MRVFPSEPSDSKNKRSLLPMDDGSGTACEVKMPFVELIKAVDEEGRKTPALVPSDVNEFALDADALAAEDVIPMFTPFDETVVES